MTKINLPARIGLVGCGAVSHQYLPNLLRLPGLTVSAVSDVDPAAAAKVSDQYGVAAVAVDELIEDPEIDIVVNLTPISFHVPVTRDLLNAGKHVYSEKPLATTLGEAQELLALADAKGLVIGGAPDTLLGTAFQAARRELDGALGRPLSAVAIMLRSPVPRAAYFAEHKALFDMAPYYISALVTLFGPVRSVLGYLEYDTATAAEDGLALGVSGTLLFGSGMTATLSLNWGSTHRSEIPVLDVYTDSGVLRCANPNNFGDPAYVRRHDQPVGEWLEIPGSRQPSDQAPNLRGLGVAEMAGALASGRRPRASGDLACHVVDVIESLVNAARSGQSVSLTSSCEQPEPLFDEERLHLDPFPDPDRSRA